MGDKKRNYGEISPHMSTTSILVSVEDLIHMAMGPDNVNVINFKLLQTVLHILARQMRLLEQRVEVKISDYITMRTEQEKEQEKWAQDQATSLERRAGEKQAAKAERDAARAGRDAAKASARAEKETAKAGAKAEKEAAKAEKDAASKADKEAARAEKDAARADKEAARADKEAAKTEKEAAKASAKADKEAAKSEKEALRTAEREKKSIEKALAAEAKDKEKQEKASAAEAKDKEKKEKAAAKGEKAAEKEKAASERAASKEREKEAKAEAKKAEADAKKAKEEEKEKAKRDKSKERGAKAGAKGGAKDEATGTKASDTSIVITEEERDKQKVLVVEKGPTTRPAGGSGSRSIEVVTRSQFDLLKELVSELAEKAGPMPMPSLPKNKELLQRLSKGTASLTDMMGAMQVNARVVAAEQAIGRMGGILTHLATAGALPEDIAGQVGEVTSVLKSELKDMEGHGGAEGGGAGGVTLDPGADGPRASKSVASAASRKSILAAKSKYGAGGSAPSSTRPSTLSGSGTSVFISRVTHTELDDAVRTLKDDMMKNMQQITAKAATSADNAMAMAKGVAEKLEVAMKLNDRISTLNSQVTDYAEQLSGFDAGLATQMQGFSEQMNQMRMDLKQGLNLLESVNNNAETAAVMELTERYEGLVTELDHTLHFHQELTSNQGQLGEDLRGLIEAVEMLREQKADRDEVQDGLRDKADNSRLAGLLTEEEFARSRAELERRLHACHDKFERQNSVWMEALKELKTVTDVKADMIQLLGLRDEAQDALQLLHQLCQNLALVLGEPKAAILTRKLTRGALCAACMAPALQEAQDAYAGAPPPLPKARPRPTGAPAVYEEPCEKEFKLPEPQDMRDHICRRWVGGSHTLVSQGVVSHVHGQPMNYDAVPTSRFTGYGMDGRLYMMEEELQPCLECNKLSDEVVEKEALPPIEGI